MSRCPFDHGSSSTTTAPEASKCPVTDFKTEETKPPEDSSSPDIPRGACPLGFSRGTSSTLSPMHCPLCKSLFFECCAMTPCGHAFCAACAAPFSMCPICGVDVEGTKPFEQVQQMVDTYIDKHGGQHAVTTDGQYGEISSLAEAQKLIDDEGDKDSIRSKAMFLCAVAMRSAAGRNIPAALSRACASRGLLADLHAVKPLDAGLTEELAVVSGKIGDLWRSLGRQEEAAMCYEESCRLSRTFPEPPLAILSALCVSLNKLGDLSYLLNDFARAAKCYEECLSMRERIFEMEPSASHYLDCMVAKGKYGDVLASTAAAGDLTVVLREAIEGIRSFRSRYPTERILYEKGEEFIKVFERSLEEASTKREPVQQEGEPSETK